MAQTPQERAELIELMESRKAVYTFLSTAYFEEMTLAFLEGLRNEPVALDGTLGAFAQSLANADLAQVRCDLAAEYARLFLNMSRTPIPPYESVYTSDLHILMQDARDEVLATYRSEGIVVVTEVNIPEDHLALELDFMVKMCQKTIDALVDGSEDEADRCLDVQAAFVEKHLCNWVPQLCLDVKSRTRQQFYRGVAELTEQFIASEAELLAS